jgi:hypothetical protein
MTTIVIDDIQFKRAVAARWTTVNPVLRVGEPGFETDTNKLKIGDGTSHWNDLDYLVGEGGGEVDPEEIEAIVIAYLEENPPVGGVTQEYVDAADEALADDIADVNAAIIAEAATRAATDTSIGAILDNLATGLDIEENERIAADLTKLNAVEEMVEVPAAAITNVEVSEGRISKHVYVTQPRTSGGQRAPFLQLPPAADHEGEWVVVLSANGAASATVCEIIDTPTAGVLDWTRWRNDFVFQGLIQPSADFTITWNLDGEEVEAFMDISTLVGIDELYDAMFGPLVAEGAILDLDEFTITSGTTGPESVVEYVGMSPVEGDINLTGMGATLTDSTPGAEGLIRGVDGYGGVLGASLWYPEYTVISDTGTHNHNDVAVSIQRGARIWAVPAALNNGTAKWSAEVWPVRDDQIIYRPEEGLATVHHALDAFLRDSERLEILRNGNIHAGTLASSLALNVPFVGDVVLASGTPGWYEEIREVGNVLEDQSVEDGGTGQWIWTFSGRGGPDGTKAGAIFSDDGGETWSDPPVNLTPDGQQAEDPYIAKDLATNLVYRDSQGRAYLYAEEKIVHLHVGICAWRSTPGTWDFTEYLGQVAAPGPEGSWNATDISSPIVGVDTAGDGSWHLFVEGRRDPGLSLPTSQEGQIGHGVSDDGLSFTLDDDPIIPGTDGAWDSLSTVPDDIALIGTVWNLTAHGQWDDGFYAFGVYQTTDDPADWNAESFVDHPNNPIVDTAAPGGGHLAEVMFWGDDYRYAASIAFAGLYKARIALDDPPFVDPERVDVIYAEVEEQSTRLTSLEFKDIVHDSSIDDIWTNIGNLGGRIDNTEFDITQLQTDVVEASKKEVLDQARTWHKIEVVEETNPGTDIQTLGQPDALDGASSTTPPNLDLITSTFTGAGTQGLYWDSPTPPDGMTLLGVRVSNVQFSNNGVVLIIDGVSSSPVAGWTGRDGVVAEGLSVISVAAESYTTGTIALVDPTTDPMRLVIGIGGNLGEGPYTGQVGTVEWLFTPEAASGGGGAELPIQISDVENLQDELDGKAATVHNHIIGDTAGLQAALDARSLITHTHPQSDITDLVTDLAAKVPTTRTLAGLDLSANRSSSDIKTALSLAKGDVGLGNVDNTSDANKPISTATQTALDGKAATSHTHSAADVTSGTFAVARLPRKAVRKSGDTARTDDVLTADPHLSLSLEAGTWILYAYLFVSAVNNTPDIKVAITGGSSHLVGVEGSVSTITAATPLSFLATSTGTAIAAGATAAGTIVRIEGTVVCASTSTVAINWAQNVTTGGAATSVLTGSFFTATLM